jgi:hypothetical protein
VQLDLFPIYKDVSVEDLPSTKLCVGCKEEFPLDNFRVLVKRWGDRHTISSTCRFCDDKAEVLKRDYRKNNPLPDNYKCPLCDRSHEDYLKTGRYLTQSPFSVDHCQFTMSVRGYICNPCNSSMGLAQHDPDLLRKMAEYLEHTNGTTETKD